MTRGRNRGARESAQSARRRWQWVLLGTVICLAIIGLGIGVVSADAGTAPQDVCDATVAENESIQNAIDAASEGETVCLEDGSFDQQVVVNVDGLTVQAADGATPVLDGSGHDGVGVNVTAANVTVEGLTALEYGQEGVLVDGAPNVTVANVNASHNGWLDPDVEHFAGIAFRGAPDGTVIDSAGVDNGMQAVRIEEGSDGAVVENVTAIDNYRSGIWAGDAHDVRIANSTAIDNALRGIHVEAVDEGTVVTGAEVLDNGVNGNDQSGVRMIRTEGALVENNTVEGFDDGDRAGITVDGAASDVHVVGNHLEDGERGIFVGTDETTVENNVIRDVGEFVGVRADNVTVTGNDASNATFGYRIGDSDSQARTVTVDGDTISDVTNEGIRFFEGAQAATVTNATIEDVGTGIRMGNADGTTVEHSAITGADRGLYQVNSSAVTVRHTEILESDDVGYELTLDNVGTIVENNTIAYGGDGVDDGGENGITLLENDIVHNSREGVSIDSDGPVVSANNLSYNRVGVQDTGSEGALIEHNHVQASRSSGIEVQAWAKNATVVNNTVLENHHDLGSSDGVEPGILVDGAEDVSVVNNTVAGNDEQGIAVEAGAVDIHLDGNDLADQPVDVLVLATSVTLTNNTLETGVDVPERGIDPFPEAFHVHGTGNEFTDGAALDILTAADPGPIDPDARQVLITDVEDETLTAGEHGAADVPFGLFVSASANLTISNATVEGATDTGVRMAQVESVTLAGVETDGEQRAVLLEDAGNVTVADVTMQDTAGVGLEAVETPGLVIDGLGAVNTTSTAIDVDGASELSIDDATVQDFDPDIAQHDAVVIDGATDGTVRDTVVSESTSRGLDVSDSDGILLDNVTVEHADQGLWLDSVGPTVRESAFLDNDEWGIRTSNVPDGTIEDSTFAGNEKGLILRGDNVTVTGNTVLDNEYGVVIDFEWQDVVLSDNHFEGNVEYGVWYDATWPEYNVTATDNYWGATDGPSGGVEDPATGTEADGDGDRVDADVLFDPWLSSPPDADVDVQVTIDDTNSPVTAGETLAVAVTVENEGDDGGLQTITLEDFDGTVVDEETADLGPGESTSITLEWNTDVDDDGDGEVTVRSEEDEDSMAVTIESAPDPAAFDVDIDDTNSPVEEGAELVVDVTVTNAGDLADTQVIELDVDGIGVVDSVQVEDLGGGENVTVELRWDTAGVDADTYDVGVASEDDVDAVTVAVEEADDDDDDEGGFTPPPPPPSDDPAEFVVTEFVIEDDDLSAGQTVTATITVENVGDETGDHEVTLEVDGAVVATETVTLDGGESTTVTLEYLIEDTGTFELRVDGIDEDGESLETITVEATPDDEDEGDEADDEDDDTDDEADDGVDDDTDDADDVTDDDSDETDADDTAETDDETDDEAEDDGTDDETEDDGVPGFGLGVTALVLLSATLLAVREQWATGG